MRAQAAPFLAPPPMTTGPTQFRKPRRRHAASPAAATMAMLPQWMQRTPTLMTLKEQARTSQQMWATLQGSLPLELAAAVRPGRWAEGVWNLTASSPAVAAKLKLYGPLLLRQLQQAQWPLKRIMVRVQEPGSPPVGSPVRAEAAAPSRAPASVRARLRALQALREKP